MKYRIKPSFFVVIITIIYHIIILFAVIYLFMGQNIPVFVLLIIIVPLVFAEIYMIANIPLYSYIDEKIIKLKKVYGEKVFSRDLVSARPLDKKELNGAIRLFGIGGVFGYFGLFKNSKIGNFYMITANLKHNLLLITTEKGKKYVINCPYQ